MIAVIGAGRWGTNYLRTFMKLGEKVGWLYSRKEETLRKAIEAAHAEGVRTTTSYGNVLADTRTKAVVVATDASTHFDIARQALGAGKHVLVEKPIALRAKDAAELARIAKKKKLILMAGHLHRYNPGIQKLKEEISRKEFGKVKLIRIKTTSSGPVREDMSALWDMLPHDITIASYLLGKYPESVSAKGEARLKKGRADIVEAKMNFRNARTESYASWIDKKKQRIVEVIGEKGDARYDDYGKKLIVNGKQVPFENTPPLEAEARHFIECVNKNAKPLTDGNDGLKNVKILEAMQKSMESGKETKLLLS